MSTSMALLCAYAAPERSSACRCWASSASCPTGTSICSPSNCAGASRSRHGKAASTISSHEGYERRCWRSSTVTPGCDAPSSWCGRGLRCNAAASTSCATSSAKCPNTRLPRSATTSHRIVHAANAEAARTAYTLFERTWGKRCSGVVTSLREGGEELLTFFRFPKEQRKTLRTTNTIERLHEEFRRRVKTQSSLPTEDSAVVLLFSLVASGQIRLRRVDGWQKIATVLSQNTSVAA